MKAIIFFVYLIIGLFIFYIVIETAVRKGINNSIIGQFLEKKYGVKEDKKSFLDDDLDNEIKRIIKIRDAYGNLYYEPFFKTKSTRRQE
ncbi:hypothetical protein M3699_12440 [Peribacillus simplex]|uniref:hypothetical protein n=1 Tax=Peribacillus simplex TaxID=1478 RepID=UPI00203F6495|nr:hypothetical protein [Peribacillus simplex]MCM3674673.1 hypothetical protein [Peribacillus simplex]